MRARLNGKDADVAGVAGWILVDQAKIAVVDVGTDVPGTRGGLVAVAGMAVGLGQVTVTPSTSGSSSVLSPATPVFWADCGRASEACGHWVIPDAGPHEHSDVGCGLFGDLAVRRVLRHRRWWPLIVARHDESAGA